MFYEISSVMHALFYALVEPILYIIIGATVYLLGNLCPSGAKQFVKSGNFNILQEWPLFLDDVGTELVQPALPALLGNTTRELVCRELPILLTIFGDKFCKNSILVFGPLLLGLLPLIGQLHVPRVALDHRLFHILADHSPGIGAMFFHGV